MTTEKIDKSFDLIESCLPHEVTPFPTSSCCPDCTLTTTLIDLRHSSNYWESQFKKAKERENELKELNETLKARISYLEHQLYSKKSEKHLKSEARQNGTDIKRKRGHQAGEKGHNRLALSENACKCPNCGLPFNDFPGTEDSEEIVIEVQAHRRINRRKRYTPSCTCPGIPGIITAPAPPKLIPKSRLDLSIWVHILIEKYLYQRPLNKVLESLADYGVALSGGTVCDNLQRLSPLFVPLCEAIHEKSLQEKWWHADETRWMVMELIEGKLNYRWYIWVFVSPSTVVYVLAPGRDTGVVKEFFGSTDKGFLCVDRYSAYKCFVKTHQGFILVFCWAHVRRDFLDVGKQWPKLEQWALSWVNRIGMLYHLNKERLVHPLNSSEFSVVDAQLHQTLVEMDVEREIQLKDSSLHIACRKTLESLRNHWPGLIIFADHPHIPIDNSEAERAQRNNAVGRKNYYGSRTILCGHFTAMLFSIFQTLVRWQINPRTWLRDYLTVCSELGGLEPKDISAFLPWNMSADHLAYYRKAPS
jgi:transposase